MNRLALLAVLFAWGCNSTTSPTSPEPAQVAPPQQATVRPFAVMMADGSPAPAWATSAALTGWEQLGTCTGILRPPAGLLVLDPTVYLRDGNGSSTAIMAPWGELVGGYYQHATQEVHVVDDRKWVKTWKHEQLHLLLDLEGQNSADHSSPLFAKCS